MSRRILGAFFFFAGDIEGFGRLSGQWDLWAQIFRHRLAVCLILIIHLIAERVAALVKDDRHVGRRIRAMIAFDIAVQHVAKSANSADRQPIRLPG